MYRELSAYISNIKNGAIGFMARPLTNPVSDGTTPNVQLFGMGNSGLANAHIAQNATNRKFYLTDYLSQAIMSAYVPAQTLNGNITNAQTTITVSGTAINTNDIITIDTEQMLVTAGGGTTGLTVTRAYSGTAAVAHTSGAAVTGSRPTVTAPDSASAAWYWIVLRWETPAVAGIDSTIWLGIWDSNRNFVEELAIVNGSTLGSGGATVRRIFLGQLSGTSTASWHIGNVYLQQGSGWTPIAPNFAAQVPNSGPGADDSAVWTLDTGVNDATNEYGAIDETTLPDLTYVKCVLVGSLESPVQFYGHAAGLVPAGNRILAAAVVPRRWEDAASNATQDTRMKLGSVTVAGPSGLLGADSTYTHEFGLFRATDPNALDWTIANLDAMRPGHKIVGTTGEQRVSQLILYAAYVAITASLVTLPAGGNPKLNPLLRR